PFLIPPIYPGARFIVYCILEKGVEACKEITLSASSHDGPMRLSIPLDPEILKGSKIHTLAARKLIQDIEDGTSFIHKHPRNMGKRLPNSLIRKQIVKLGVMYNLASKYTSFLAIDERNIESVAEGKSLPSQKIVPVSAAAAYSANPAPTPTTYYSASRSAAYSPPPPPAANCYSQASPAAQSPSATNNNSTLAGYFSSLKTRKSSLHSYFSKSKKLPQFPGSNDSVMHATGASKTSKATSFSSNPMLSNRSQLSSQPYSMSLNTDLECFSNMNKSYNNESFSAANYNSTSSGYFSSLNKKSGSDSVIQAASVSKTSKAASLSSSPILSNRSRLSYQSRPISLNDELQYSNPILLDGDDSDKSKNDFKDFEVIGVGNEKVLCLALAIAYLEIIMFETFKDECEMCYGKAKKALKKEVGDEQKIHEILEKVKEWVKKWADE
ncbi:23899_t:CDS:2, partial [Racocetra persica]